MRTSTSVLATFISLGLAGFATSTASAQNTLTVCPNGCDFTSIAQAYSAASDDDVIEIGPGVYPTSLTINGSDKPLTFVGTISSEGGPATVLQPVSDGEGILRFWGVSDLTFRDLEFSGCSGRPAASFFNESTLRFEHCIFRDNEGTGTGGEFGGAVHSNRSFPTFVSCQFLGNSDPRGGAVFAKNGGHARFYDCILIGNTATVSGFTGSQHNVGAIWWNDDLHGSPFQGVLMTIDGCVICDNIQSGPQITVDGYQGSDNCISAVCDSDEDGVLDCYDGCPDDSNKTEPGLCGCGVVDSAVDSDDDGTLDCNDAFPNDDTETVDSDGDGVGDNADAFPNDETETADSDGDGVGDNADAFPDDESDTAENGRDPVGEPEQA
ncbi:MAG: hypothetical protein VYC81_08680, partial [Actinomycetota bacterium]|nr:hypothetical protein [Actinomycetota bacterium]